MNVGREDFEGALNQLADLEKSFNMELANCEKLASGHLVSNFRDGRQNYLQVEKKNGKYCRRGITGDTEKVKVLCRKKYILRVLDLIAANRRCLETAERELRTMEFNEILQGLPAVYQTVPEEYFQFAVTGDILRKRMEQETQLEREIREWAEAPYEQSSYKPWLKTNTTSRGEKMRSKGEVNIAEKLYQYDVPFRYEEVLRIGSHEFAPDFKPRRRRDGKIFYLEHCGMPFDEKYMARHKWKMEQYESVGIVPWDNLIVTYNDIYGNLDMRIIESEIVNKLV